MLITRRGLVAGGAMALALAKTARAETNLAVTDLYADNDFTEQAKLFNGNPVTMQGFMAPPLRADTKFFVLTTIPMAVCPFCSEISQWPKDIVVVYTRDDLNIVNYDSPIVVDGKLDLGEHTDDVTGFVSMVRLVDSTYRRVPSVSSGPGTINRVFDWW